MARRRRRRSGSRGHKGSSSLLWAILLFVLLGVAGAAAAFVVRVLATRETFDTQTLCPSSGPTGVTAILLDLTDPLGPAQTARLQTLLEQDLDATPVHAMVSVGVVSQDSDQWGAQFALCKPATGEDASTLYQNPRLLAERFEEQFHRPFRATIQGMMQSEAQDQSPIMESLQALLSETPSALDDKTPLTIIIVSDLLQHSNLLSFYRNEGWDSFEASGGAERLSRNLHGASIDVIRIPRLEAPESARALIDEFWGRYLDRQGATVPIHESRLGDL